MGFQSVTISELSDDYEDDFQLDILTKPMKVSMHVSEQELRMMGHSFTEVIENGTDSVDGNTADSFQSQ